MAKKPIAKMSATGSKSNLKHMIRAADNDDNDDNEGEPGGNGSGGDGEDELSEGERELLKRDAKVEKKGKGKGKAKEEEDPIVEENRRKVRINSGVRNRD
jgi:hypothetical protein